MKRPSLAWIVAIYIMVPLLAIVLGEWTSTSITASLSVLVLPGVIGNIMFARKWLRRRRSGAAGQAAIAHPWVGLALLNAWLCGAVAGHLRPTRANSAQELAAVAIAIAIAVSILEWRTRISRGSQ